MASISSSSSAAAAATSLAAQKSPWHSPVPYLFGGLAAMLGLIAFALLILACSYWKLSGYLENRGDETGENRDLEAGEMDGGDDKAKAVGPVLEEKYLVIMAGQEKPTYLATPMSSRTSSFGCKSLCSMSSGLSSSGLSEEEEEEDCNKMESGDVEAHLGDGGEQVH